MPSPLRSLKIVAWLFIIIGAVSVAQILFSLFSSHININLNFLGIFIGQGLLRFNPRAWKGALFFIWIGLIFIPTYTLFFLLSSIDLSLFGLASGQTPSSLIFVGGIISFLLVYWQYTVLTDYEVRRLFA